MDGPSEVATKQIDKFLTQDFTAPKLVELMKIDAETGPTFSGLADNDYPVLRGMQKQAQGNIFQIKKVSSNPLPLQIVDHFSRTQCHCIMGLFPEINRAWITIDTDIYIWTYETNLNLAYFEGINETILCVGLAKPKLEVFHSVVKYLLVVATAMEIIVLGVTLTDARYGAEKEINFVSDPLFTFPTDGHLVTTITAADSGRIFFGTKEGSLFEISYHNPRGWFGKRCKIVNLSTSALSFLLPSFIMAALTEEDCIVQIVIDNSRNILYTLTENGAISVCDLGERGNRFSRITKLSQVSIVNQAVSTVKTLDSSVFRPIVSIAPIEVYESMNLNLVAITKTGMRFYFTVSELWNQQPNARPYTLTLAHVRLPPGYSANITIKSPGNVHKGYYRDRNAILLANINRREVLWCLSSELFPFSANLMEAYTILDLEAPALAITEIRDDDLLYLYPQNQEQPPLVVRQHVEPPKTYVVLTTHTIEVFMKLRPVDILKQILQDSNGQKTLPLTTFFSIQSQAERCSTSLILATLLGDENAAVAELASRAFFLFGGEPQLIQHNQQSTTFSGPIPFSPHIMSTPARTDQQNQFQTLQTPIYMQQQPFGLPIQPSTANFSHRHNGLYLYLSRIIRLVWNRICVEHFSPDGKFVMLRSTISLKDCMKIQNHLMAFHNFLTLNTDFSGASSQRAIDNSTVNHNLMHLPWTVLEAKKFEELKSLEALKIFVCHFCQIMSLWRILCDHPFHELLACLPDDQQDTLLKTTFKELFLVRQDICNSLVQTLVKSYLDDNASVDIISNRLTEACPHWYKPEDVAFTKVNELFNASRITQNEDEKEEMLLLALQLCKNLAPNVNLAVVCSQFTALKAYKAVIELCSYCAKKLDPENIAIGYFHSEGNDGFDMYHRRMEAYKEIIVILENLSSEQDSVPPGTCILREGTEDPELSTSIIKIIEAVLVYDDEVMHAAVYDWMIARQMTSHLLRINSPSLEHYLKKSSIQNPNNVIVLEVLWKYYEIHSNHASAATILDNLASSTNLNISLKERLTYLVRAIMCMSSDRTGYPLNVGVFLRHLEDKMAVAKVQNLILDEITNFQTNISKADEAISALNSRLYTISELYENFADTFGLLECKLAVIDCAGYTDNNNALAKTIWNQILVKELQASKLGGVDRIRPVLLKVQNLARLYKNSNNTFPLTYIAGELETINAKLRGPKGLVPKTFIEVDIDFQRLIHVYISLINLSVNLAFWQNKENQFHLIEVTCTLIMMFINNNDFFNRNDKRKIIAMCQDTVIMLLLYLSTKTNSDDIVHQVEIIQSKLSEISNV